MEIQNVQYSALCLTHNCNLRCKYCYSGEKKQKSMSKDTAKNTIDFLHETSGGNCIITFFGGEPLLEYNLMEEIIEYSKNKYNSSIQFRMSTNGTLLNMEKLNFLNENNIIFVLSIDGAKDQHDANRVFANGTGSFETLNKHIDVVLKFNPYTIAVSVVNPDTADYIFEGVTGLFNRGFRYVLQSLDYSAEWNRKDIGRLKKEYKKLAEYYFKELINGYKIYYSPFDERILTWAQKPYGNGDLCDLANTQIAIAPSGTIYPCVQFIENDSDTNKEYAIGDISSGFNNTKREYFIEQNYKEKISCKGCALQGRCATFCGCVNFRATGSLDLVPPIICEHERMLMPIVDRLANKLWKRNSLLFKRKFYERTFPISSYIEDCYIKPGGNNAAK